MKNWLWLLALMLFTGCIPDEYGPVFTVDKNGKPVVAYKNTWVSSDKDAAPVMVVIVRDGDGYRGYIKDPKGNQWDFFAEKQR